jgi:hypothetical protein
MQDLFSTRLQISSGDPIGSFDEVLGDVFAWAWRGEGDPPDPRDQPVGQAQTEAFTLTWRTIAAEGHPDIAVRLQLRHGDDDEPGLEWTSSVDVVGTPELVRVGIRLSRVATELRIAPAPLDLHPPRLVGTLIARHECSSGDGIALGAMAPVLQPGDIVGFVGDVMTLPERQLPVLLLSPPAGRPYPEGYARLIAQELAGLAHVYVLSGRLAWERLRDELGPGRVVPGGGARLYWPGFEPTDTVRHPHWTRQALRRRPGQPAFRRDLFDLLAPLSVLRVPPDPAIARVRAAETVGRMAQLQKRSAEAAVTDAIETLERLESSEAETLALRTELQARSEEVLRHEENWAALHSAPRRPEPEANGQAEVAAEPVESWVEVAELAEILADTGALVFTDNARRQLADCPYPDPDRMFRHLEPLAAAAEAYRAARAQVNQRFEDWIRLEHHLDVSLHDETLVRDGVDRFDFDGESHSREPHVKVDDYVDPASCGRIYFALDPDNRRLIVDHVGLHL